METQTRTRLVACLVGTGMLVVALIAVGGPAGGAAPASIAVTPNQVAAGNTVTVTGTCDPNTTGFAISTAFLHDAAHDFAGVGAAPFNTDGSGNFSTVATIPASTPAGNYTISGRCGGGNIGVTASLSVTNAAAPSPRPAPGTPTFTG